MDLALIFKHPDIFYLVNIDDNEIKLEHLTLGQIQSIARV